MDIHLDQNEKPVASSAEIDSKEMSFDMSAQSSSDGLRVFARLDYGYQSGVALAPSDVLVATADGVAHEMKLDGEHYTASFAPTASPSDVVISLTRPPSRVSAPQSTVRAPAPFRVVSAPSTITDGDVVRFEVSPPPPDGARVTFRFAPPKGNQWATVDGTSCLYALGGYDATSVEGGIVTLDTKNVFYKNPTARVAPECDAAVFVRYETNGKLDSALKGGTISGLRESGAIVHIIRVPGN